ncbi:tetratricopeptide repeat protein [Metapseudomonas otitidis]|uniref:tetratricopeptide repeat protein n=1 Tax=Metapseudomonas otitidis TaxID=319939 RepID=UPI0013F5C332|nr:sel1 repeat family protein [Pseudomonas otitidis]
MINYRVLIATLYFIAGLAWADLTPEQSAAKDKGLMLYQQYKGISAIEPLRVAAEAGDRTAQYYLGETLRRNSMYITAESRKWYEAAAAQGDLFAMLRLSDSSDLCDLFGTCTGRAEWRDKVLDLAYARAEHGDTEAMWVLFHAEEKLGWLEKAAEAGDGAAQLRLAKIYSRGAGWFLIPGNRQKEIRRLLRASAESGYAPGMLNYALVLLSSNPDEAALWLERAAKLGYVDAVIEYASSLGKSPNKYHLPRESIKGAALMRMAVDVLNEDRIVMSMLSDIEHDMSEAQVAEAKVLMNTLKTQWPPLSHFVPVYGH